MHRSKEKVQRRGVCVAALLSVALAPALQGCLLTRVLDTRTQLCDDQPARVIVTRRTGSGLRVVFEKPTLTDRDVVWIVGYEPTTVTDADATREFTYEAVPLNRPLDRADGLVARLAFDRREGNYRLAEVEIPEKFNSILSPPLLDAVVRVVCKAEIGIAPPSTKFDLAALDRTTLPARETLMRLLGAPTGASARTDEVSYQYCLAPCAAGPAMVADVVLAFGSDGELHRVDASYFRYSVAVDLISSKATATVQLH
jgi:hypothetical protein